MVTFSDESSPIHDPVARTSKAAHGAATSFAGAIVRNSRVLAVVDQSLVSGTSFLSTFLLARWGGPTELGTYSLAMTGMLFWTCTQESLITGPFTVFRHQIAPSTAQRASAAFILSACVSLLACVSFLVTALVLNLLGAAHELVKVVVAAAVIIPFALTKEFGRGVAFAEFNVIGALMLDGAVAVTQLGLLASFAVRGDVTALEAVGALGGACALASIVWVGMARRGRKITRFPSDDLRRNWQFGRWLFANQAMNAVQAYVASWIIASLLGYAALGVYSAVMALSLLCNPILLGLNNVMAPHCAARLATGDRRLVRRSAIGDALLLAACTSAFCLGAFIFGKQVLQALLPAAAYVTEWPAFFVLSLAALANAVSMPATNALAAFGRPKDVFVSGAIGVVLSLALLPLLSLKWAVLGAALAYLAGSCARTVCRWAALREASAPATPPYDVGHDRRVQDVFCD